MYVAALYIPDPPPAFLLVGKPLAAYLAASPAQNGLALDVQLDFSRYDILEKTGAVSVNQTDLNQALQKLLGDLPPSATPPIGLILTNQYATNSSTEGFMFDLAGVPNTGLLPRQGCALFLNAIDTGETAATSERLTFQAIHELGHALNLWHLAPFAAPPNFMTAPPPAEIAAARCFNQDHASYASHAADPNTCQYVLPGGSCFGERGPLATVAGNDTPFAVDIPPTDLKLEITLSQKSFYAIEPVELDITISLAKHAKIGRHTIPAEVDPGYSRFKLWLTYPNGERRLFPPSVRFCATGATLNITRSKPFRRDVAILGSARGYTFGMPGKYTLQATFELAAGKLLVSNTTTCLVKKLPRDSLSSMAPLLRPDAIQLLLSKDFIASPDLDAALSAFINPLSASHTAALIHYALGKGAAKALARTGKISARARKLAATHLAQAMANGSLGDRRKRCARQALKAISGKPRLPKRAASWT